MSRISVTLVIDTAALATASDRHLATLWHVAQANPAPLEDKAAGEAAEGVGREIVRRWLASAPVELYAHQGEHHYWDTLRRHGQWVGGVWTPTQDPEVTP